MVDIVTLKGIAALPVTANLFEVAVHAIDPRSPMSKSESKCGE